MDPIDDALADLRITGNVLLHNAYVAPWGIAVPAEARLRAALAIDREFRVLPFHLVRRHRFTLRMDGHAAVSVSESEVTLCPSGAAHVLSDGAAITPVPFETILAGEHRMRGGGAAVATELVCGVFMLRAAPLNPMLAALPPVLKVSTDPAGPHALLAAVTGVLGSNLAAGRGSFTASRVLEVFCAEMIRAYQTEEGGAAPGWFRGLSDPRVGEAMRLLHADVGRPWTVEELAGRVALSPSRFAARFRETTGQSVMAYLARWRINVACRLLSDTELAVGEVAARVGYDSLPAFSRAFKARMGQAPAHWRDRRPI